MTSLDRCDILIIFVSIFVINTSQHDNSRLNAFTRLKVLEALIALHLQSWSRFFPVLFFFNIFIIENYITDPEHTIGCNATNQISWQSALILQNK